MSSSAAIRSSATTPTNLNVRVAPDVYLAFGVDALAIRPRKLYLPWEIGKPPDFAMEVASASTARQDVTEKRRIYARIGVPEYWRFDPKDGDYHGAKLAGEQLVNGVYRPIELTREPDGILKGYSDVLGVSVCWAARLPRLYDPPTNTYLESGREVWAARLAAEAERGCRRGPCRGRAGRPTGRTSRPAGCRGADTATGNGAASPASGRVDISLPRR